MSRAERLQKLIKHLIGQLPGSVGTMAVTFLTPYLRQLDELSDDQIGEICEKAREMIDMVEGAEEDE